MIPSTKGSGLAMVSRLIPFFLAVWATLSLISCADHSVYLVPNGNPEGENRSGEKINVLIRPIYTSDFQSEDREKYRFDFSSHFTPIEIHFHNGTPDPFQWNPDQTLLKDDENKEYRAFNEDEAFHYYKSGSSAGNSIVLLDKPYEQQKEDIENIKRFMIKPVLLPPGGDVTGLLLFEKVLLKNCEHVELIVGGIQINQRERSVKFSLRCPEN